MRLVERVSDDLEAAGRRVDETAEVSLLRLTVDSQSTQKLVSALGVA
jgi:hypothetical protein